MSGLTEIADAITAQMNSERVTMVQAAEPPPGARLGAGVIVQGSGPIAPPRQMYVEPFVVDFTRSPVTGANPAPLGKKP